MHTKIKEQIEMYTKPKETICGGFMSLSIASCKINTRMSGGPKYC
jgi:hypothetical protein